MNRKHSSETIRLDKKRNKEVKKGLKTESVEIIPLVSRAPSRFAKVQETRAKNAIKNEAIKKAKDSSKRSKRTTTHESVVGSVPAHVHTEGKRWISTLRKQTKEKTLLARKKTCKTKSFRAKKAA